MNKVTDFAPVGRPPTPPGLIYVKKSMIVSMTLVLPLLVLSCYLSGVCYSQGFANCDLDLQNPELPDEPTLCELINDFDNTPTVIGNNPSSTTYWSNTGLGYPTFYGVANQDIVINGTLIIDDPAGFHNCRIKMAHNSKVIIPNNEQLLSLGSKWFACNNLWAGIKVNTGGALRSFGSKFEDATTLITADDGAKLTLYLNEFNRNYVGITNGLAENGFSGIIIEYMGYNTFSCNAELNSPAFGSPYDPPISYAGISLNTGSIAVGSFGQFSAPNYFEYLLNGIVLTKSSAQISNMHFSNMIVDANVGISGRGISAVSSTVKIRAELLSNQWYGRCTFENCVGGAIIAEGSNIDATGPVITGEMDGGILSTGNRQSESVAVKNSKIVLNSSETVAGIYIKRGVGSGSMPHYNLSTDSVFVHDNFEHFGWGINLAEEYPSIDEAWIEDNYIFMTTAEGMTGIGIVNTISESYKIRGNELISTSTTEGDPLQRLAIRCVGVAYGYNNEISENSVEGAAVENSLEGAICIDEFGSTQVCDNAIDYSEIGIHILGNNGPFEITASDINRHERGMLIDDGLLTKGNIGAQLRRNNIWGSSGDYDFYAAECNSNPVHNLFFVQSSATGILPDPRDPGGNVWFKVDGGDPNECGENSNIDPLSRSDSLIFQDELFDVAWTDAQIWSAHKQLMLKLLRFPALRPNGSDAKDYFDVKITESPGKHAQVEYDYMQAFLSPSGHSNVDAAYEDILFWLDSLSILQDQSRPLDTLDEDTGFTDDLEEVLDTLSDVLKVNQSYREDIREDQDDLLEVVYSDTRSLPVDSLYEYYNKRLLQVLVEKALDDTISESNLLTLDTLAAEEPSDGGVATKYARMVLGPCTEYSIHEHPESVEELILNSEEILSLSGLEMNAVYDPSSNKLNLTWSASVTGQVLVVDILGHVLGESHVFSESMLKVQLKTVPGLYFVTFRNTAGATISKPVWVNE